MAKHGNGFRRNRTQEVAGSSPASSTELGGALSDCAELAADRGPLPRRPTEDELASSLARDDLEEVPVLGVADCCLAVLLDLVEVLDFEPAQQFLRILACLEGHIGLRRPAVAVAEELSAEATAGPQR